MCEGVVGWTLEEAEIFLAQIDAPLPSEVPGPRCSEYKHFIPRALREALWQHEVRGLLSGVEGERLQAVAIQLSLHQGLVNLLWRYPSTRTLENFDECVHEARARRLISGETFETLKRLNGAGNRAKHEEWVPRV